MSATVKNSKARKPMKPWRGWAMVSPSGRVMTICKAPSIYGTKRDVLLDLPNDDCTARYVEVREIHRGR